MRMHGNSRQGETSGVARIGRSSAPAPMGLELELVLPGTKPVAERDPASALEGEFFPFVPGAFSRLPNLSLEEDVRQVGHGNPLYAAAGVEAVSTLSATFARKTEKGPVLFKYEFRSLFTCKPRRFEEVCVRHASGQSEDMLLTWGSSEHAPKQMPQIQGKEPFDVPWIRRAENLAPVANVWHNRSTMLLTAPASNPTHCVWLGCYKLGGCRRYRRLRRPSASRTKNDI